jgi:hypothetical protein
MKPMDLVYALDLLAWLVWAIWFWRSADAFLTPGNDRQAVFRDALRVSAAGLALGAVSGLLLSVPH